jgi:hypothetical protein
MIFEMIFFFPAQKKVNNHTPSLQNESLEKDLFPWKSLKLFTIVAHLNSFRFIIPVDIATSIFCQMVTFHIQLRKTAMPVS